MDSQASVLTTLHSITSIKRQELAKQRDACQSLRSELQELLENETNTRARVRLLLKDAGKRDQEQPNDLWLKTREHSNLPFKKVSNQHEEILTLAGISAPNVQRFLDQSERDASIPSRLFEDIEEGFQSALRAQEIKYEYATLFSDLVTERATDDPSTLQATESEVPTSPSEFESVGRSEMHEQRKEWESLVFNAAAINPEDVNVALEQVFSSPEAKGALETSRRSMKRFCHSLLEPNSISEDQMKANVAGLIESDLLSDEQTAVLKQLRENPTWIREAVDVIDLRLRSIERWSWGTDALPLEMRRQLNGKYRVYMHEEVTQALLIYHIGIKFATQFRSLADSFLSTPGWKKFTTTDKEQQAKFEYFIGDRNDEFSDRTIREDIRDRFDTKYFMSSLPKDAEQRTAGYGDDDLNESAKDSPVKRQIDDKHGLLHLIATESLLADALGEELLVLQTDFRWFGPSLPHTTIFTVLKFFGVTEIWLEFFEKFIRTPMRFLQDGANGAIHTRERGVPMSHILSDFLSEAVLFCVDFAVNEATEGKPMYRMHDDIWFWGDSDQTVVAWETLTRLIKILGIEINQDKTGTARLSRNPEVAKRELPPTLPTGSLNWGLLSIKDSGTFEINQSAVDKHIAELQRQLASRKSVLGWIKAYNTYMKFFSLHFCSTANALGLAHVDDCLSTFQRINEALAASTQGSVAAYVKNMITSRFHVAEIPDGFLYFPMLVGGLELHNPLISLQNVRETVVREPSDLLRYALEIEDADYLRFKTLFDEDGPDDEDALASESKDFLSREEFKMYRRDNHSAFTGAWDQLLLLAEEKGPERSSEVATLLQKSIHTPDNPLELEDSEPYWKAVSEIYGPEMGRVFGGLYVVEKGLLPLGMLSLFKGRVRWDA